MSSPQCSRRHRSRRHLCCASCARWCHRCGFFFTRMAGRAIAPAKVSSLLSREVSFSLATASRLFGRIRLAVIAIAASDAFSAAGTASAIWLIVAVSTSVALVASVAFVGVSCTSLAVAVAVVAITAVFVVVAKTRATPVASSVLAKLLASHFCSRPCLPDVALTLVALDNYCPRGAFLRSPIATQSPFC